MGQRNLLIIVAAIFLGLIAVFLANSYFSGVETQQAKLAEENRMARIAVASQALEFGTQISQQNVRLVNWPANSVPDGAFTSIEEATRNRVALRPIVPGEPVLASKVSGANGRAVLSANLPEGQVAFTIPISEVAGVGGFARPGDIVDVLLTRQIPGEGAGSADKMTDVIMQAVPVLATDQIASEQDTAPKVSKSATLQVDLMGAQKLALSTQLGALSLALRNVADQSQGARRTVTQRDVSNSRLFIRARTNNAAARSNTMLPPVPVPTLAGGPVALPPRPMGPSMTIVRGTKTTQEELIRGY
jgi:pilus assembly protein CpaB